MSLFRRKIRKLLAEEVRNQLLPSKPVLETDEKEATSEKTQKESESLIFCEEPEKLQKADEKLAKVVEKLEKKNIGDEDEDEIKSEEDAKARFPNLKYAKPKYKNIESILKYTETEAEKGGIKLVIMNFND